jgi:hypothetical protein
MNLDEIVGHYRLKSVLGGGGMGVAYLTEELPLGRPVELKVLPPKIAGDPQAIEHFRPTRARPLPSTWSRDGTRVAIVRGPRQPNSSCSKACGRHSDWPESSRLFTRRPRNWSTPCLAG